MRKLLYGTTALVAAGLISGAASNEAWAQKAPVEKIQLGLGGYFQVFGVFGDQDLDEGLRNHAIAREAEIYFLGKTTLDNGLEVGAQVQLEADGEGSPATGVGDYIDESFVYFEGGWGRINLGSENSAAYLMHYATESASGGSAWGVNDSTFSYANPGTNLAGIGPHTLPNMTSDSEKITYFTPRLAGFQLGASYTPDSCEDATGCGGTYSGFEGDEDANDFGEIWEVGANYVQKLGTFDVAVSGSYGSGTLESQLVPGLGDDPTEWTVGFQLGFAGFTVGGAYRDESDVTIIGFDRKDYNAGVRYVFGPWGVGVVYGHIEQEHALGEDETDVYEVGGNYVLGPGVDLKAGVQFWDLQGEGGLLDENEATIVYVGTALTF